MSGQMDEDDEDSDDYDYEYVIEEEITYEDVKKGEAKHRAKNEKDRHTLLQGAFQR